MNKEIFSILNKLDFFKPFGRSEFNIFSGYSLKKVLPLKRFLLVNGFTSSEVLNLGLYPKMAYSCLEYRLYDMIKRGL